MFFRHFKITKKGSSLSKTKGFLIRCFNNILLNFGFRPDIELSIRTDIWLFQILSRKSSCDLLNARTNNVNKQRKRRNERDVDGEKQKEWEPSMLHTMCFIRYFARFHFTHIFLCFLDFPLFHIITKAEFDIFSARNIWGKYVWIHAKGPHKWPCTADFFHENSTR